QWLKEIKRYLSIDRDLLIQKLSEGEILTKIIQGLKEEKVALLDTIATLRSRRELDSWTSMRR
ncbi:hypothetical protein, partial [Salmonella enterica]